MSEMRSSTRTARRAPRRAAAAAAVARLHAVASISSSGGSSGSKAAGAASTTGAAGRHKRTRRRPAATGGSRRASEETFAVADVLSSKRAHGRRLFLIQWEGYSESTWEPQSHLPAQLVADFDSAERAKREQQEGKEDEGGEEEEEEWEQWEEAERATEDADAQDEAGEREAAAEAGDRLRRCGRKRAAARSTAEDSGGAIARAAPARKRRAAGDRRRRRAEDSQRRRGWDGQQWEVDAVVGRRHRADGGVQYEVRWKDTRGSRAGGEEETTSWVDAADCDCPDLIARFEERGPAAVDIQLLDTTALDVYAHEAGLDIEDVTDADAEHCDDQQDSADAASLGRVEESDDEERPRTRIHERGEEDEEEEEEEEAVENADGGGDDDGDDDGCGDDENEEDEGALRGSRPVRSVISRVRGVVGHVMDLLNGSQPATVEAVD